MSLIYTSTTSRHNLYIGGQSDAKSLTTLKKRNVRRILNVTPAKEAGITAGVPNYFENSCSEIKYKRIPVYDASSSDLLSRADEMVEFISNGLHHGGVLVHCQKGVSRSATAVIMFLMRKANMTLTQSLKLCQRRRPVVDPIPAFLDQLATYERECRTLGYLTAVDDTGRNNETGDNIAKVHANGKDVAIGGQKRKVEVGDGDDRKKNKVILGPVIGPSAPTTPPITCPVRSAVIGPARGPPTKEQVVENPKSVEAKESN